MAELAEALRKYGNMSFNALKTLTHVHPSYEKAWAARGNKDSHPMRYEDMLEEENRDPEVIEDLEHVSQFSRC